MIETFRKSATGVEAGINPDEQIKIALQTIQQHGGQASINDIYQAVEMRMKDNILSPQGQTILAQHFLGRIAVDRQFVTKKGSRWLITRKGQKYLEQFTQPIAQPLLPIQPIIQQEPNPPIIENGESQYGVEPNEELLRDEPESVVINDIPVKKPYDPTLIRVDAKPFSIFDVMRRIKLGEIELQPDFQRLIVWKEARQSRLIESILLRIPLPSFYLDAINPDKWQVIDGLQRLYTLHQFINLKALVLTNLEYLDLEGKTFEELPRNLQRNIEDTMLNLYIIQPGTPPNVKFTIFSRVNTGGLVLKPQEIRHAIFQGASTRILADLAKRESFLQATNKSIQPTRMDDRECILRFLAFTIRNYTLYNDADFNGFLSDMMGERLNKMSEAELDQLATRFEEAMEKARLVFGPFAFRKMYDLNGKRLPINKSLFEAWSVCLSSYSKVSLVNNKEGIMQEFVRLMNEDKDFEQAISQGTGSITRVQLRFRRIEELLARVVK